MSDSKLPQTRPEPTTDLTETDQTAVTQFIADGMPGLASIDDVMISRICSAYLEGRTYSNIANMMRVPRSTILYLSDRFGWYQRRRQYQDELALHIQNRVIDAKIASKDFLVQLTQYFQKRLGKKVGKFYETDNEDFANEINYKEVDKLLKVLETLNRMTADGKDPKTGKPPLIGLNIPDGATVERNKDGSVEITPKEKAHEDMIETYANYRRQQEADKAKKSSDIDPIEQETNPLMGPQGDKVDEND